MGTLNQAQMARLLIGHEVVIGVGEPWNFEGPDGSGRLQGRIVAVNNVEQADGKQSVSIDVTPFESEEGALITNLVGGHRYVDEASLVEQLATGERAPANLSYTHQVPEPKRIKNVVPKLIGSIRLS